MVAVSYPKGKIESHPMGRMLLAALWPRGILRGRRKLWLILAVFLLWYVKRATEFEGAESMHVERKSVVDAKLEENEYSYGVNAGCDLPDEDSGARILSALSRTKTVECRNTLAEAYCKLQDGSLFATPFASHPRCVYVHLAKECLREPLCMLQVFLYDRSNLLFWW